MKRTSACLNIGQIPVTLGPGTLLSKCLYLPRSYDSLSIWRLLMVWKSRVLHCCALEEKGAKERKNNKVPYKLENKYSQAIVGARSE